jgi:hypothetical protein
MAYVVENRIVVKLPPPRQWVTMSRDAGVGQFVAAAEEGNRSMRSSYAPLITVRVVG